MKLTVISWAFFSMHAAMGQSPVVSTPSPSAPDSVPSSSITRVVDRYHDFMRNQELVFNGVAFVNYSPSITGTAFWRDSLVKKGSVLYDRVWYHGVSLLYDIVADKLIISDRYQNYLCPVPEKVEQFVIDGHTFVRTPKGYCDVLCSGPIGIQARRIKTIQEYSSVQDYSKDMIEGDHFYMVKGATHVELGGVKSLLALLGDKKNAVRKYLRKNNISLRKNRELAIVTAAEYYNQLSR
jgi:hypothetical protein